MKKKQDSDLAFIQLDASFKEFEKSLKGVEEALSKSLQKAMKDLIDSMIIGGNVPYWSGVPVGITSSSTNDTSMITPQRQLELLVSRAFRDKYGDVCPVSLKYDKSPIMSGVSVEVKVQGQSRIVLIDIKKMNLLHDPAVAEQVCEEVLFAAFLLLDEDDEDV